MKSFKEFLEESPDYDENRNKRMEELSKKIAELKSGVYNNPSQETIKNRREKIISNNQRKRRQMAMGRG